MSDSRKTGALSVAIVLLAALALSPRPAASQADPYEVQVFDQMLAAATLLASAGYELTHDPVIEKLPTGGEYWIRMDLYAGVSYGIMAVCDNDCLDIDLELYDGKGNLIDDDTATDDTPIVEVRPRWNDEFRVRVSIPSCRAWRCTFGLSIWGLN